MTYYRFSHKPTPINHSAGYMPTPCVTPETVLPGLSCRYDVFRPEFPLEHPAPRRTSAHSFRTEKSRGFAPGLRRSGALVILIVAPARLAAERTGLHGETL